MAGSRRHRPGAGQGIELVGQGKLQNAHMHRSLYTFAVSTYPVRTMVARVCRSILKMQEKRVVFVFGMSRSGTTFLGRVLALDERTTCYVHEPVKRLMRKRYGPRGAASDQAEFWRFVFSEEQKLVKLHFLVCTVLWQALFGPRGIQTIVIKPISMLDCMEEVSELLGGSILFISRHPCGYAESIVRQRRPDAERGAPDLANLMAIADDWGRIQRRAKDQIGRHPEWQWIVFERLCQDPEQEVASLYRRLGLEWNGDVLEKLGEMTTTHSDEFYGILRDSRAQIDKWCTALTSEQIEAIRAGCAPHNTGIYEGF